MRNEPRIAPTFASLSGSYISILILFGGKVALGGVVMPAKTQGRGIDGSNVGSGATRKMSDYCGTKEHSLTANRSGSYIPIWILFTGNGDQGVLVGSAKSQSRAVNGSNLASRAPRIVTR